MTTILLIRHGENSFVGKRLAGRLPGVHLNDRGQQQAQQLALNLCKAPLKAIYSSPLERALETAEPLAAALGLPVQLEPGLIELAYGDWQGKTLKQLARLKLWKVVQERPSEMRFPRGESFDEVQARAVAAVDRIAAAHEEGDLVACFSHGDVIRLLVGHYLGVPLDLFQRLSASTASISAIHIDKKGRPAVLHVNQVLTFEFRPEKPDPAGGKTEVFAQETAALEETLQEAPGSGAGVFQQPLHPESAAHPQVADNGKRGKGKPMSEEELTLPEVSPVELADWLKTRPELVVLDVREPYEAPRAKLSDPRVLYAPMSELARKHLEALPEKVKSDKDTPLVVICHHGNRSAQVTAWLLDLGWQSVYNLAGGIDAYARTVDPTVGMY